MSNLSKEYKKIADVCVWGSYEIRNKIRRKTTEYEYAKSPTGHGYRPQKLCGKKLLAPCEVNQIISDHIISGTPFWAGRMGYIEMDTLRQVMQHRMVPALDHRDEVLPQLCNNAGFFPNKIDACEKFVDLILESASGINMQGFWNLYMEDYLYKYYQPCTKYPTVLENLEPWYMYSYPECEVKPWSHALKDKTVLVIHPFADTIKNQYENKREQLFSKQFVDADDILPPFKLVTFKAVQSIGGGNGCGFSNWFDALQWMIDEIGKLQFDVAIIGCGAYGYPIAAYIKGMGKIAIHLGGATQLMFGIIGNRWEREYPELIDDLVNESWVRPSEEEKPAKADSIEQGCYW